MHSEKLVLGERVSELRLIQVIEADRPEGRTGGGKLGVLVVEVTSHRQVATCHMQEHAGALPWLQILDLVALLIQVEVDCAAGKNDDMNVGRNLEEALYFVAYVAMLVVALDDEEQLQLHLAEDLEQR